MPDRENPVVAYHAGSPKSPAYDGFAVDSRRLPAGLVAAAQLAGEKAQQLRLHRIREEQGFEYLFQVHDFLRVQAAAREAAREWPVVDVQEWTVHSDHTLTGEAVAEMLGLDDEWRTILDLPPNTEASWEQVKHLANVALTRNYLHAVETGWAELTGLPAEPRPSLREAADFLERVRKEENQEGTDA